MNTLLIWFTMSIFPPCVLTQVWDQAADTYALDKEMADKLRKSNPQASLRFIPMHTP